MSHHNLAQIGGDAGYSMIELLMVMSLTVVIAIPLMTFSYKGLSSFEFLQAQSNTSTELSTLSQRIGKVIRGATGVLDAQANTLTIYGYFSPADTEVKKIRYFISGTNLNIGVTKPDSASQPYTYVNFPEVVTTTRVDLVMGGTPMFTYYDETGAQLANGFANSQIKEIGLFVAANPSTKQVPVPISLTTRVTLRNFKTNL